MRTYTVLAVTLTAAALVTGCQSSDLYSIFSGEPRNAHRTASAPPPAHARPAPTPTPTPAYGGAPTGPAPTLSFGDPTPATAAEVAGRYVIDPRRSVAVIFAYWESQAAMWGHAGGIDPETRREAERHFAEIDSTLDLHPGGAFTLRHRNVDEDEYYTWTGNYRMVEGVLHLDRGDVDDLPVTMQSAVTFNYYRTAKFDGLVVNNYMWGMVFKRG